MRECSIKWTTNPCDMRIDRWGKRGYNKAKITERSWAPCTTLKNPCSWCRAYNSKRTASIEVIKTCLTARSCTVTRKPTGDAAARQNRAGKSFGAYALCITQEKNKTQSVISFDLWKTRTHPDVLTLYLVKKGYSDRHEKNNKRYHSCPFRFGTRCRSVLNGFDRESR